MESPSNGEPNGVSPAPEKKKTLFETILTTTPVLLTVVATFMVGQSSGEMTRAQYHRSVAGQNQSKVGDQWGFFQAKRIRGTTYEVNADMLLARDEPLPLTIDSLYQSAEEIGEKASADNRAEDDKDTPEPVKKVVESVKRLKKCLEIGFRTERGVVFKPEQVKKAFETMKNNVAPKLPRVTGDEDGKSPSAATDAPSEQQKLLEEVVKLINQRKPEKEIARQVIHLTEDTLNEAIAKAEADRNLIINPLKKAEDVLEHIDQQMYDLAVSVNACVRILSKDKILPKEKAEELRTLTRQLMSSYYLARHTYTHRRYEKDARANQKAADLYEVRVYLSSARSDRHLQRSTNFLYAMLVAQVGVVIASTAMAVKRKSLMWLAATLAGLVAIGFGGYVFLGMS